MSDFPREVDNEEAARVLPILPPWDKPLGPDPHRKEYPPLTKAVVPQNGTGPEIYSLADLEDQVLPAPREVVPGVIQVGLNMLAGKSKLGKSWLALDIALAVASEGRAMGKLPVVKGDVLYLALEDNKRRMQGRTQALLGRPGFPRGLHVAHQWPKLDEGGLQAIEGWLKAHPEASLVVVDIWKRIRHTRQRNANLYDEDYEHMVPLQALALQFDVAVLVIHHTRKAVAEDVYDEISGSGGVMAALDTCIILHRSRSEADGEIFVTGRDIQEAHLALKFEAGHWLLMGQAAEVTASKAAREILETVNDRSTAWTPALTAEALGKPRAQIKALMFKMLIRGELKKGPNSTYLPALTALTVDSVDSVDRVDRVGGQRSTVNATPSHAGAPARGCPSCGVLAYTSSADGRRKCNKCKTVYGEVEV